ncbi:DUF305 domain-containing protein [Streptomyces sp. NA04227]|uniref:DUF305 domain-containing protein n=1 Tax=Streptomyces sp. NA04227 TaxID=2742136 RepID=UPI0020CA5DBD|nr:DUF305 domain-containing protein [Streptomyces sp. NA04227]
MAVGAAVLVLAACGSEDDGSAGHEGHGAKPSASSSASSAPSSAAKGRHNDADAAFATGMIPHHRQAVEMAALAPSRARSAEVKQLAADIKKAQEPEIRTLSGWLRSWGKPVPAEGAMDHSSHGGADGPGGMSGMMTPEEMAKLEKASGAAFDTAFMELMIKHHEGAVSMAKTEQADGSYPAAQKMAGAIITSQSAEIAEMNRLLGRN